MRLGITSLVHDVVERLGRCRLPGALHHAL
jgi:hypothetical protein